jgi:hypothetical protein
MVQQVYRFSDFMQKPDSESDDTPASKQGKGKKAAGKTPVCSYHRLIFIIRY